MNMLGTFIRPMHPEGFKFVGVFAVVAFGFFLLSPILGWIGIGLTIWCYYFFRDPERVSQPGLGSSLARQMGSFR